MTDEMGRFEDAMAVLAAEERAELSPLRKAFRQRARETFEDFYPALTPDQIRESLGMLTAFSETEIEIIESFYATISYARTAKELQLDPRKVRNTVLRALTRLPEGSQLRTALQMAFAHLNIRQEPDG